MKYVLHIVGCLLLLLTAIAPTSASCQYLPLVHNGRSDSLSFDLDRLWTYNLYEHHRWGGGLTYVHRFNSGTSPRLFTEAWMAYGTGDKRFKYGLSTSLSVQRSTVSASILYDLRPAASRRLGDNTISDLSGSNFTNNRMVHVEGASIGYSRQLSPTLTLGAEMRYSYEECLFATLGLVYPDRFHNPLYRHHRDHHIELRAISNIGDDIKGELLAGITHDEAERYIRLLLQYDHTYRFKPLLLNTFGQLGWSDGIGHRVPYSRAFDLGGSYGFPLSLNHTLLTALPNEFTANAFAFVSLKLIFEKPLFDIYERVIAIGSRPRPFIAANAAWGALWDQDSEGISLWHYSPYDALPMQAPLYGIFEPVAGIEGLIRWGVVDWGMAIAYRLAPDKAPYRLTHSGGNFEIMLTASLAI